MADFDNRLARPTAPSPAMDAGLRAHMLRVYNYMLGGLALTGALAYRVANAPPVARRCSSTGRSANGAAWRMSASWAGW